MLAQWQSWLRHSRKDAPSTEELLADEERKERTKRLAKMADERWITKEQQPMERLTVKSSEEALKAVEGKESVQEDEDPRAMKKSLPGQDPGSTFEPQEWSGKIEQR